MEKQTKLNVYLFQPQYAVEIRKENTYWLPYSAGCIWSYASTIPEISEKYTLAELGFKREDPNNIIKRINLQTPSVCGFSCYVWNEQYCLALAKKVKQNFPNCRIIFGGAQASAKLTEYDFIDSVILAEGEESFADFLLSDVNQKIYDKQRMSNLDIPSPYTTGLFDKLLEDNPTALWSMTFETNRGCPYACTFCDWGGTTYSKVRKFDIDRITADLEWAIGKPVSYVFCADANFGIFKERDLEIAKILKRVADQCAIETINLQYAKNSTELVFEIAQILGEYSRGVTVSVQSMHDATLTAIKRRNMDVNKVSNLISLSKKYGVGTYTEVILGLPEETLESWCDGLCEILELGQHDSIDMWFAQLLENSELNQIESKKKYSIDSVTGADYFALYNSADYKDIQETIELIRSTSTMSSSELAEAYMFGWMIIHWHINGYSQHIAKSVRKSGITYKQYYDKLLTMIKDCPLFGAHYLELKDLVYKYLSNGKLEIQSNKSHGHNLHTYSYGFMYEKRKLAYNLAIQCGEQFVSLEQTDKFIQNHFLFDKYTDYPLQYNETIIKTKLKDNKNIDFYSLRRKGLLKNTISQGDIKCNISTH
jgi:radical SAM superfamily enzyme YgiQ (UPF0313 family)